MRGAYLDAARPATDQAPPVSDPRAVRLRPRAGARYGRSTIFSASRRSYSR